MLLSTAIFVFNKLTVLQGNYAKEISGRPDTTFSCKQNGFVCHFVDPGLGVKKRSEQNKRTLILGVEVPAAHQQMHFYVFIIELFISALVEQKKRHTLADI